MLVPNSGMVLILIYSIAFYTVFLGNMVNVLFREIHTEKCKKLLFFFSFICSCSWKRCKTPYLPTAHSSENAAGEHSWAKLKELFGPTLSWETGLLFDLTSFTFVLIFSSIVQVRGKKVKSFQCLKGKLHNKQTIYQKSDDSFLLLLF